MAECVYPDTVIRLSEGIEAGGEISSEIKAKWKAESDRQLQELLDKRAQGPESPAGVCGLEPLEAFPDPELVEPVPINEAATSPHELKQIQVVLTELRKHLGNEWETADEVFKNITYFNEWLPRTQWTNKTQVLFCTPSKKGITMVQLLLNINALKIHNSYAK